MIIATGNANWRRARVCAPAWEVADIAVLSLWFRLAVRCTDLNDFEQHLRPSGT